MTAYDCIYPPNFAELDVWMRSFALNKNHSEEIACASFLKLVPINEDYRGAIFTSLFQFDFPKLLEIFSILW
jgi:hypothetical protein